MYVVPLWETTVTEPWPLGVEIWKLAVLVGVAAGLAAVVAGLAVGELLEQPPAATRQLSMKPAASADFAWCSPEPLVRCTPTVVFLAKYSGLRRR
jgi:hypothetical protein